MFKETKINLELQEQHDNILYSINQKCPSLVSGYLLNRRKNIRNEYINSINKSWLEFLNTAKSDAINSISYYKSVNNLLSCEYLEKIKNN